MASSLAMVGCRSRLRRLQVHGGFSAGTVALQLEGDPLPFGQGSEVGAFDGRDVDENVLAAAFGLNEAEALGGVEPFDGSSGHAVSSRVKLRFQPGCRLADQNGRSGTRAGPNEVLRPGEGERPNRGDVRCGDPLALFCADYKAGRHSRAPPPLRLRSRWRPSPTPRGDCEGGATVCAAPET